MLADWVTLAKFSEATGVAVYTAREWIRMNRWTYGIEYTKTPTGRVMVHMPAYYRWVQQGSPRKKQNSPGFGSPAPLRGSRAKKGGKRVLTSPPPLVDLE